ncbi:MAG: histidine phosphatase family protein [Planctomycetota bacterium]|nr:histidine phosphatase family protein [Planctomycetota bacterium]MDA1178330.1 histidine phosphatase family protein [Planctomycetota bacterium]
MSVGKIDLFLIRHAQSLNNARPEAERVEDPGLTELGQSQAVHLAQYAASLQIERLITSPFLRTLQTTEAIVRTTALSPEIWVDLHEQGGCYAGHLPHKISGRPGMSRDEIQRAYSDYVVPAAIDEFGWWKSKPYEEAEMALERARRLLRRTCEELVGDVRRVAFVMHADFKQLFLSLIDARVTETPGNASVSHVSVSNDESSIVQYNVLHHLPEAMHSW